MLQNLMFCRGDNCLHCWMSSQIDTLQTTVWKCVFFQTKQWFSWGKNHCHPTVIYSVVNNQACGTMKQSAPLQNIKHLNKISTFSQSKIIMWVFLWKNNRIPCEAWNTRCSFWSWVSLRPCSQRLSSHIALLLHHRVRKQEESQRPLPLTRHKWWRW